MKFINKYGVIIFVLFAFFMFYKPIICFLILGSCIFYLGIDYLKTINQIEKSGKTTSGKIIRYSRDYKGYQTPTINFKTEDGKIIENEPYYFAATDFNKFKNFKNDINNEIIIKYYKLNPEKFVIDGKTFFNKITIIFMLVVSSIFLGVAIANIIGIMDVNFK